MRVHTANATIPVPHQLSDHALVKDVKRNPDRQAIADRWVVSAHPQEHQHGGVHPVHRDGHSNTRCLVAGRALISTDAPSRQFFAIQPPTVNSPKPAMRRVTCLCDMSKGVAFARMAADNG
jgi:hypothetical protein